MPGRIRSNTIPARKTKTALALSTPQEMVKTMTKAEKKVAAKALYHLGWGSRLIESWLGISDSTVLRAKDAKTPEHLKQFESDFNEALSNMKQEGLALIHRRINQLIPKQKDIQTLITAAQFLSGEETGPKTPGTAVQVNFNANRYIKER